MTDLGTLSPDGQYSNASDVSADGKIVVGGSDCTIGGQPAGCAFRWTEAGGMEYIGTLYAGWQSEARAMSADGSVIAGSSFDADQQRAFRWTDAGGFEDLGTLQPTWWSEAQGISGNGLIVVGNSFDPTDVDGNSSRAFRWTQGGGMVDLGTLAGGSNAVANGTNFDGSVVVGTSESANGDRAYRWTEAGGMVDLGVLPGDDSSYGSATNGDGTVVVGNSGRYVIINGDQEEYTHAIRWTASTGMQDLGILPGGDFSNARDVNADGTVVVGTSGTIGVEKFAFRWTQAGGMENLGTLTGAQSSEGRAVNADGTVVVGEAYFADGPERAFIWKGAIQDYSNLIGSFDNLANSTDTSLQQQIDWLAITSQGGCAVTADYNYCLSGRAGVGSWNASGGSDGYEQEANGLVNISLGVGMGPNTTIGLVAATGLAGGTEAAEQDDPAFAIGTYLMWSQSGDYLKGANLIVNAAASTADFTYKRGAGLTDVQVATESSSVQTLTASSQFAYGIEVRSNWIVTPLLGLSWSRSQRNGYTENGNLAFSAKYDDTAEEVVTGNIGIENSFHFDQQNTLKFGIGAEYDLFFDAAELRGTSDVPNLSSFTLDSTLDRNKLRGYANVSHVLTLDNDKALTTSGYIASPAYGSDLNLGATVALDMSF